MRTWIGFIILVFLYIALISGKGIVYDLSMDLLGWLNAEHKVRRGTYIGWVTLIFGIVFYLFYLDRKDKEKEKIRERKLLDLVMSSGASCSKIVNRGFGDICIEALISFRDSGFKFLIHQITKNGDTEILVDKKFMSWEQLVRYIKADTNFVLEDFLPNSNDKLNSVQKNARVD